MEVSENSLRWSEEKRQSLSDGHQQSLLPDLDILATRAATGGGHTKGFEGRLEVHLIAAP